MNEKIVVAANGYDRVDGRNAYHSDIKRMTLECPIVKDHIGIVVMKPLFSIF